MAPKRIATNSVSFVDLNDGILKGPEPTNKTVGLLWLDETNPATPRLRSWTGSAWVDQQIDLSYLDPGADDDIEDSKQKLADMADDSIVTQAERIQILNDLISITGKVDISDLTTALPTAATIDSSIKKGDFYHARQNAITAGLSAVHIDIDALEDAYLALCGYLNGLDPKPWNVWVEANLVIADSATWKQRWLDYHNAVAKLAQTVTDKIKDDADALAVRVQTTEGDISNLGDAIDLKVSTLTYEDGLSGVSDTINENIGKDKWLAKQYLMASSEGNQTNFLPTYQSIAGKHPSFMTFVNDAATFRDTFGADEYYIGYFATALYVKTAKDITFTITHDDGCVIYVNGGIGYSKNTSITTAASVTLSLMQGWNSIEIVYAEQTGTSSGFTLNAALNTLVDNLSCYGLGDAIGGRMTYAEAAIKINAESITSKVSKTDYETDVTNGLIPRMQTAEEKITAEAIVSTVTSSTTYTTAMNAKADTTYVDGIKIGGTNLYFGSLLTDVEGIRCTPTVSEDGEISRVRLDYTFGSGLFGLGTSAANHRTELIGGNQYTISCEIRGNITTLDQNYLSRTDGANTRIGTVAGPFSETDFRKIVIKITSAPWTSTVAGLQLASSNVAPGKWFEVRKIQIEDGVKDTTFSPNPIEVQEALGSLTQRVATAEQKITSDAIVSSVTSSESFALVLAEKANASDLSGYATTGDLGTVEGSIDGKIDDKIDALNLTGTYATKTELTQTSSDITAKFSATGGMNLLKNSIGYAGTDFWGLTYGPPVPTISNNELDSLGFGSGFQFLPDGVRKGIHQDVTVVSGIPYTLSWYMKKNNTGVDITHHMFVQIQEYDGTTWLTKFSVPNNYDKATNGYEPDKTTYTPETTTIRVRFIGYENTNAIITGAMLTIGDLALQWSLATGEVYNTNVKFNINGIRVSQLDENRKETGYTSITPTEFAGYYDKDGDGNFEKVFYLQEDNTVSKKFTAQEEFTMGTIKIIKINASGNNGWAVVPTSG